jgi:quercetin dioxygenase-like cupin family protein
MAAPHPITESTLREQLAREGLQPSRWSNGPGAVYAAHDHPYRKVLVVTEGSITFTIEGGKRIVPMQVGDRLMLPPHTAHSALVGPGGVVCLEAHVREGADAS